MRGVRVTGNGDGEGVTAGDGIGGGDGEGFCAAEGEGDNVGFFGVAGKRSGDGPFGLRLIDAADQNRVTEGGQRRLRCAGS